MSVFHFTEIDKQAIRDNQDELIDILGEEDMVENYETLADDYDYSLLADIAPIFEKLSDAVEEGDDYSVDYDLDDEINKVNKEIIAFLRSLPPELIVSICNK